MCRVLEVSPSGYYAWLKRAPSARAQADARLLKQIRDIHRHSKGPYGAPRIHAELAAEGRHVGRKQVARLKQAAHLQGVSRRKFYVTPHEAANELLQYLYQYPPQLPPPFSAIPPSQPSRPPAPPTPPPPCAPTSTPVST